MSVIIIGPRDRLQDKDVRIINVTSHSTNVFKQLSPFYLGPVNLYSSYRAERMENGWQYAKVYREHLDEKGNPSHAYFSWAHRGWLSLYADRYPMGKSAVPEYSWWGGEKLGYIEARKKIYIPLYHTAAKDTEAFRLLREQYRMHGTIALWDFDGWDNRKLQMSLNAVVDYKERKMGHAFVLAMMLEGLL